METVRVIDIVNSNTLAISPPWDIGSAQGNLIRIRGLHAEPLAVSKGQIARCTMTLMLLGTWVQVRHEGVLDGPALVCDVLYHGHPIGVHFPELVAQPPVLGEGMHTTHHERV